MQNSLCINSSSLVQNALQIYTEVAWDISLNAKCGTDMKLLLCLESLPLFLMIATILLNNAK